LLLKIFTRKNLPSFYVSEVEASMLVKAIASIILIVLSFVPERNANSFFTASANMAKLVETERSLTRDLRNFIKKLNNNKEQAELLVNSQFLSYKKL
jgi:hypothetical protein